MSLLIYCTVLATGGSVFCSLFLFALFSVILFLLCSYINISLDFTEHGACRKSMKEYAVLVHLQVKIPFEKYRWECIRSGNKLKSFWLKSTCLSLAVLKTESKFVQYVYVSSVSISRRLLAFHMKFKEEYFIFFTSCCVHCMIMMKCRV